MCRSQSLDDLQLPQTMKAIDACDGVSTVAAPRANSLSGMIRESSLDDQHSRAVQVLVCFVTG